MSIIYSRYRTPVLHPALSGDWPDFWVWGGDLKAGKIDTSKISANTIKADFSSMISTSKLPNPAPTNRC